MMKIRTLIYVFQMIALYSIAIAAIAGSSATAITTITANIVPSASLSVSAPILLIPQATMNIPISATGHGANTPNWASADSIVLRTTDTKTTAKFKVKSSQNLTYDVSIPPHVSVSNNKSNITANIIHRLGTHELLNLNQEQVLKIGGELKNAVNNDSGAYRGLIEITVNYN